MAAASVLGVIAALVVLVAPRQAPADPGHPGEPHDPVELFHEDFENGIADAELQLLTFSTDDFDRYQSATSSVQYGAEPDWDDPAACNGFVMDGTTLDTDLDVISGDVCGGAFADDLRSMTTGLGTINDDAGPDNLNHAVAAFSVNGAGASIEFQTEDPLPIDVENRFLTFSVNTAVVNCDFPADPMLDFFLWDDLDEDGSIDDGEEFAVTNSPIDPCGGSASPELITGSHSSDGSVLFTGDELGIVMRNAEGGASGNDHAFDDIRIFDATPQLDKEFIPSAAPIGFAATLRYTVTNTSELAAKEGWSFTDVFPEGMEVADPANEDTDCSVDSDPPSPGDTSFSITGSLAADQESCVVEFSVVADGAGTFENGPDNIEDRVGLDPPGETTLTFGDLPKPLVTCTAEEQRATQRWWFFGNAAGLDFGTSGSTAPDVVEGAGNTPEGSTVVTDPDGNLLFWANGQSVFDANHDEMPNGGGLTGHTSATQTVAAFPALGIPGKYFVVTTDGGEGNNGQLRYSVVDMSLNGGLGDVTAEKNIDLGGVTASEGLIAAPNADGTGFWVLTFTFSSPNVLAYEFDSDGPVTGSPVVSVMPSNNYNQYGAFNFSDDYTQLVMTSNQTPASGTASIIRLLDFNAATGEMVQLVGWDGPVPPATGNQSYTSDFSPSGDYVYLTKIFGTPTLYRYDITAPTQAAIEASVEPVGTLTGSGGQVKRGPDGRMYVAQNGSGFLAVVNNPDAAAVGDVGFDAAAVNLNTVDGGSTFGLPQMVTGCQIPLLSMTKTADPDTVAVGETITYTFEISNQGNVALVDIEIDDPLPGLSDVECLEITVPPGESVTCTATYTVIDEDAAAGEVVNTAVVSATPEGGGSPITTTASETTTVTGGPAFEITKSSDAGDDEVTGGDEVTYTISVANTGAVDLTDLVVVDDLSDVLDDADLAGAVTLTPEIGFAGVNGEELSWTGDLAVGEAVAIAYTVVVRDSADQGDGSLRNLVSSDDPAADCVTCATVNGVSTGPATGDRLPVTGTGAAVFAVLGLLALALGSSAVVAHNLQPAGGAHLGGRRVGRHLR